MRASQPPPITEWLLERLLPREAAAAAIGDLNEEYEAVQVRIGRASARRWYRKQAVSLAAAYLRRRRSNDARLPRMDIMQQDVRYAVRSLLRSPGYSMIAVAVLALGIGATSAIFSFVDGIMLRPLPYDHAERIVMVWEKPPGGGRNSVSTMNFADWRREGSDVFEVIAASSGGSATMSGSTEPVQVRGSRVSATYFDVFGAKAALGRTFAPGDEEPGKEHVAVISHRFWEGTFAADPSIIGRTLVLDRHPYTVIGVLPANSAFNRGWPDLWRPLAFARGEQTRNYYWLQVTGRVKPGVSIEQAQARMSTIAARIAQTSPSTTGWGVSVEAITESVAGPGLRNSLKMLLGAVGMLLLVGCANLANLALARGTSREREVVVRAALGASRGRIVRQFLTESLVLSITGGALGLAVGYWLMDALKMMLPPFFLPREVLVTMDWRALAFVIAIAVTTGLLFGTAPAFQAWRTDLAGSMRGSARTATAARARRRLRDALVIVEIALSCILLVGGGLLMRSFMKVQRMDVGRDPDSLLTASLGAADSRFSGPDEALSFYRRLYDRLLSVPGVTGLAMTSALPTQGWGFGVPIKIAGRSPEDPLGRGAAGFKMVTPSYFATVGLSVVRGRGLRGSDSAGSQPVIVINQRMADRYWKNGNPIGQHVLIARIIPGKRQFGPEVPWEVVGVVANERVGGLDKPEAATTSGVYAATEQSPLFGVSLLARTTGDAASLTNSLKAAVREIDPDQPVTDVRTLANLRDEGTQANRLRAWLMVVFSGLALLLAAVGVYGVISYSVAQRTHEIGVRAALGASRRALVRMVMFRATMMTALGLIIGLGGALAAGKFMATILFDVSPRDGVALAAAATTIGVAALVASWLPARRAAGIDPIKALREQ